MEVEDLTFERCVPQGFWRALQSLPPPARRLIEVPLFSLLAPLMLKLRFRGRISLVHNDCITGDIYVNHGLHKALIYPSDGKIAIRLLLRNPLHVFLLARESLRYRLGRHSVLVNFATEGADEQAAYYRTGFAASRIIPNGVDLAIFAPDVRTRTEIRNELHYGDDDVVGVFIGNEFERKGLPIAMEAIAQLGLPHKLLIVGGTSRMIEAARALDSYDPALHQFVGQSTEVARFMNAADYLVLPSSQEAAPLVILEAMACSLPVVATDTGSVASMIVDGKTGYITERSVAATAAAVKRLESRQTREDLAEASLARAGDYDWERVVDLYLAILREVAS